jgi:hypothetical protein
LLNLSFQMILAKATDLKRSTDFYSEVFQFSIAARELEVATVMVNLQRPPTGPDPARDAEHHPSGTGNSRGEFDCG